MIRPIKHESAGLQFPFSFSLNNSPSFASLFISCSSARISYIKKKKEGSSVSYFCGSSRTVLLRCPLPVLGSCELKRRWLALPLEGKDVELLRVRTSVNGAQIWTIFAEKCARGGPRFILHCALPKSTSPYVVCVREIETILFRTVEYVAQ